MKAKIQITRRIKRRGTKLGFDFVREKEKEYIVEIKR